MLLMELPTKYHPLKMRMHEALPFQFPLRQNTLQDQGDTHLKSTKESKNHTRKKRSYDKQRPMKIIIQLHENKPSLASSASFFPYKTQQQLRNIIGILPMTTSFCIGNFLTYQILHFHNHTKIGKL